MHKTNVEPINENSSLEARVYWADHMTVQLQLTTTESAYLHHVAACSIPNKSACTHSQGSIVAMSGYQHRRTIASAQKTLAKIGVVKIDDGQGKRGRAEANFSMQLQRGNKTTRGERIPVETSLDFPQLSNPWCRVQA